jgi:hypothetical protein
MALVLEHHSLLISVYPAQPLGDCRSCLTLCFKVGQIREGRPYYILAQLLDALKSRLNAFTICEVHGAARRVYKCAYRFSKKGNRSDKFFVALNSKCRGDSIAC